MAYFVYILVDIHLIITKKRHKIYILVRIHLIMIKGSNKYETLGKTLTGVYTLTTFAKRIQATENRAIYVLHRLRKAGYIKTTYGAEKKRIYSISPKNKQKGISYTDVLNKFAPSTSTTLATQPNEYRIHERTPTPEEVLIHTIQQKDVRRLIASLILFRKITDWGALYQEAKRKNLIREVIALYEIARKSIRKIKKMPKRFKTYAKNNIPQKYTYIIHPLSSKDFTDIEKKWKVYIPLNHTDLEDYRR
jgi:hypothetical protein